MKPFFILNILLYLTALGLAVLGVGSFSGFIETESDSAFYDLSYLLPVLTGTLALPLLLISLLGVVKRDRAGVFFLGAPV